MPDDHSKAEKLLVGVSPAGTWHERAWSRFRHALDVISGVMERAGAPPSEMPSKAVELGYAKLEGMARKEQAAAAKDFSEAEAKRIDSTLNSRVLEHRVRKRRPKLTKLRWKRQTHFSPC